MKPYTSALDEEVEMKTEDFDAQEWVHSSPYGHLHLRDLFAAFAMAGIIASDGNPHAIGESWAAAAAYTMADAMLAQRNADSK